MIAPKFEQMAGEFPNAIFVKVDVDEASVRIPPCLKSQISFTSTSNGYNEYCSVDVIPVNAKFFKF